MELKKPESNLERVAKFVFVNKSRWIYAVSLEDIIKLLNNNKNKYEAWYVKSNIVAVSVYQKCNDEVHALYLGVAMEDTKDSIKTIKKLAKKIMKKEKVNRISYLNPNFDFKVMKG